MPVSRWWLYGLLFGAAVFVTSSRHSHCPVSRVADCFTKLLPVITSTYKENCHQYTQFRACFTVDGCTERQAATIGSQVMLEVSGVEVPKEFLIAFLGNWRRTCGGCLILDGPCSPTMKKYDLQQDSLYFDQLQKVVLSLHRGNLSSHIGCARLKHVLASWYRFRAALCPSYRSECLCEEVKAQLERRCHLSCSALLNSVKNRSSAASCTPFFLLLVFLALLPPF